MKLYIWDEVDFGAYHADGTAVVLAATKVEAVDLLMTSQDTSWGTPIAPENRPKIEAAEVRELAVVMDGPPRVIAFNYGCDC